MVQHGFTLKGEVIEVSEGLLTIMTTLIDDNISPRRYVDHSIKRLAPVVAHTGKD